MLDFRPKGGGGLNFLGRREQLRLLGLVCLLGLVLLLVREVRNPTRWGWFDKTGLAAREAAPEENAEFDRAPADPQVAQVDGGARPRKLGGNAGKRYFPGIKPELLREVRDDAVHRPSEGEAFYHLLGVLSRSDESVLASAALGTVTYTQLFDQPKVYRGQLVRFSGTVRRVLARKAFANQHGITDYYQLVVEPADQDSPVIAYVLKLPKGFPVGENVEQPVRLTAFFYKRWAYAAGDGLRTAPLLLAKSVEGVAPAAAPAPQRRDGPLDAVWLAVAFSLIVLAFVRMRTRRLLPSRERAGGVHFSMPRRGIGDAPPTDPREALARLAQAEIDASTHSEA